MMVDNRFNKVAASYIVRQPVLDISTDFMVTYFVVIKAIKI